MHQAVLFTAQTSNGNGQTVKTEFDKPQCEFHAWGVFGGADGTVNALSIWKFPTGTPGQDGMDDFLVMGGAGPTGGAGVAWPAGHCSLILPVTSFAIASSSRGSPRVGRPVPDQTFSTSQYSSSTGVGRPKKIVAWGSLLLR